MSYDDLKRITTGELSTMPLATHKVHVTLTDWKTSGRCSNALCMERMSTLSLFICSGIWTSKRFGLTSAKRMMAVDLLRRLRGITGKGLRYAKLIGGDGIQQAGQTA